MSFPGTSYPCPLDESVMVYEVAFESDQTHAFTIFTQGVGVIFLDEEVRQMSWCTQAHIDAIFAHELGHISEGEDEQDAERWAIEHLHSIGKTEAAQLLEERGVV